jgi:hypothetical protein
VDTPQVVKTIRRRRLVRVRHRVVFGTLEAVQQVLAACGWQINTAFVEVRSVGRKEAEASGVDHEVKIHLVTIVSHFSLT